MLNLDDFLNVQKQILNLENKNNRQEFSSSVNYIEGVHCFSIITFASFFLYGLLFFVLSQHEEHLVLFSIQYAFISLTTTLSLFFLNDKSFIIANFSKPFAAISAFPTQLLFILICGMAFLPISALASILFDLVFKIPLSSILAFSITFSVSLFLFCSIYCFRFYRSLKIDNIESKCYKSEIEELNNRFINSVHNFDDYLLFNEYANIHNLKNKESILSKIENNLINNTRFKNFTEYKVNNLLERTKTNDMIITND